MLRGNGMNETLGLFKPPIAECIALIVIFAIAGVSDYLDKKKKKDKAKEKLNDR